MILGLLLLLFLLGVGAAVLSRQPMWRELLHGPPEEPPALPPPDFTRMAELEHEVWGDREHTNADIDAHCWVCHPEGTPEAIGAMTPATYAKHREKLLGTISINPLGLVEGQTHDIVEGVRVRKGGAITNTPFAASYREHVEEENDHAAWIAATTSAAYEHLVQHHMPPPDPGGPSPWLTSAACTRSASPSSSSA